MASTNFLKKLRQRIAKKKSYDIETPCSPGHGTILLRRYDRVPSTYGADGLVDHRQNILRDFMPSAQKQPSPGGRFRGDVTLPRHFRMRTGHHRTQSNVTVVDHDEIDLYNAIGDHRRSSCSCTTPHKLISPITPPNGTLHTMAPNASSSTVAKCRNAAKDPLPPIIRDERLKELEKEQQRLQQEGKFAVAQDEVPRYTGIDDYSNVDFEAADCSPSPAASLPQADGRPAASGATATVAMVIPRMRQADGRAVRGGCETLPPPTSKKQTAAATSYQVPDSDIQRQLPEDTGCQGASTKTPVPDTSGEAGVGVVVAGRPGTESGLLDVIEGYYITKKVGDLPIPHESCLNKDRAARPTTAATTAATNPPIESLSCSAPSGSLMNYMSSSEDIAAHARGNFPQNSAHHEYKEAHQVLRATSAGRISNLHDLEVSSSVEDLYAHVPKGAATKPADLDDFESCTSDPNTDNEDSLPPPPIPTRNYRTDACCPPGGQSTTGSSCACSRAKDLETGEEFGDGPSPPPPMATMAAASTQGVIHEQPLGRQGSIVEPIHMTLEEVWHDACARGIPMEMPATMTLNRRRKSGGGGGGGGSGNGAVTPSNGAVTSSSYETISPTASPVAVRVVVKVADGAISCKDLTADDSAVDATTGTKKKEKFKLKNIFKKTDRDCSSKSPTPPRHHRTLSEATAEVVIEEASVAGSDPLNTSGEADLSSDMSESFGNNSNCSSTDSGVDDSGATNAPEPTRTINADFIDSLRKLKDCGWYWGPLSWDGAEARLANKPDGSFLVRDSSDDRYILSISFRSQGTTHHTRIEHYKGTFSFFSQPKSHGAGTIIEFIEKAMEHSRSGKFLYFLRPRAPGLPPAPVQLLYPVSRFRVLQSLQHMCRFEILRSTRYDHIDKLPLPQKLKSYLRESQYYTEFILEYMDWGSP